MFVLLLALILGCMAATPSLVVYSRYHTHLGVPRHVVVLSLSVQHTHAKLYFPLSKERGSLASLIFALRALFDESLAWPDFLPRRSTKGLVLKMEHKLSVTIANKYLWVWTHLDVCLEEPHISPPVGALGCNNVSRPCNSFLPMPFPCMHIRHTPSQMKTTLQIGMSQIIV